MNISQLINQDRKNRLDNLTSGGAAGSFNMNFISRILDGNNNQEEEKQYVPRNMREPSILSSRGAFTGAPNTKPKIYGPMFDPNQKSHPSTEYSYSSSGKNSCKTKYGSKSKNIIDLENPSEICKFVQFKDPLLPKPTLSEKAYDKIFPDVDKNKKPRDILQDKKNLQEKLTDAKGGRLYGIHRDGTNLHNKYYQNNLSGVKSCSSRLRQIGPRYIPGWNKMPLSEKLSLQRQRKEFDSEHEEMEEIKRTTLIKEDNKKRRREQKRNDKFQEEINKNQKQLQEEMDRRYIKYIKEKKRKQRHFQEESVGKLHDTKMCANGWMKTNLNSGPKEDKAVDIKSMIDLDFDPSEMGKPKTKIVFKKEQPMDIGAAHIKHEIEDANDLSNSLHENSIKKEEVDGSEQELHTNENLKALEEEKNKIRAEVKERVKKLNIQGKIGGDSESIEEILIETKRDAKKRRDAKRLKIIKSAQKSVIVLSDSYHGSHEDDIQEIPKSNADIEVIKSSLENPDSIMQQKEAASYLDCQKSYDKEQTEYDNDEIPLKILDEKKMKKKTEDRKQKKFETRKENYMKSKRFRKRLSALTIKQRVDRKKLALEALGQFNIQSAPQVMEIKPKEMKIYGREEIVEEVIQQKKEANNKDSNHKNDNNNQKNQKDDSSDNGSEKYCLDSCGDEDKPTRKKKQRTNSDIELIKQVTQDIISVLSDSDQECKKKQKEEPPKPKLPQSGVNPLDLENAFNNSIRSRGDSCISGMTISKDQEDPEDYQIYNEADEQCYDFDKTKYDKIVQHENNNEEFMRCDICMDNFSEASDTLVICELCNVAVHQKCYGKDLKDSIPKDAWYCNRCKYLHEDNKMDPDDIKCYLCSDLKGCIVKSQEKWAHVTCVLWVPEISYKDFETKTEIIGNVSNERWLLKCSYCKSRGAALQCQQKFCSRNFHVRCAISSGVIVSWSKMIKDQKDANQGQESEKLKYLIFCKRHLRRYKEGKIKKEHIVDETTITPIGGIEKVLYTPCDDRVEPEEETSREISNDTSKEIVDPDNFIVYENTVIDQAKRRMARKRKRNSVKNTNDSQNPSNTETSLKKNQEELVQSEASRMKTRSQKKNKLVNLAGKSVQEYNLFNAPDDEDNTKSHITKRRRVDDDHDNAPSSSQTSHKYISKSRQSEYKNMKTQEPEERCTKITDEKEIPLSDMSDEKKKTKSASKVEKHFEEELDIDMDELAKILSQ
ncbi:unnamed protein product [Moneuplotes crassus]|uniref:Uncharacterized protein n=1 Tax=Euplotes crassus TaxID=5936 RepID=A0AAD1XFG0_EUPCR|nr:unnamed protein product [Moneuplotes crassus]